MENTQEQSKENDLKKEILHHFFYDECQVLTDKQLNTLISRDVELVRSSYGSNADLFDLFVFFANTLDFINNAVGVIKMFPNYKDENQITKLLEETEEKINITTIDKNKKIEIIEYIIKKRIYK